MDRIHPPRKLRFHWNGQGVKPDVGDFLRTPPGTTYEILEVRPAPRTRLCFQLLVWRIAVSEVPSGARIIAMHWLRRKRR